MGPQAEQRIARSHRILVVVWPLLAALACAVMWATTLARAGGERERAQAQVRKDAGAYATAYEQYITRSVGQMDQVAMQLKYSWEHNQRGDLLERLHRDGMFTDSAFTAVALVGRDGVVRSATRLPLRELNLSGTSFFAHHRNNISTALRVGAVPAELGLGQHAILFTRRLDTSDDEFDGVVVLAVDARYFTSFVGPETLGAHGLLALAAAEGRLRLEQGDGKLLPATPLWRGDAGVRLVEDGFADHRARVLGWRRAQAYPLVAVVALSQDAALAGAQAYWIDNRNRAIVATAVLALLGACGALLSRRAALREREREEVRRAYRTATESANDGFYMAAAIRDRKGEIVDFRIVDCNQRGAAIYGLTRSELVGARVAQIDTSLFGTDLMATYRQAMETGFHQDDRQMPSHDRVQIRWGRRRLVRVGNALAVTLQDISERKAHEQALERLANQDGLTGLSSRNAFLQRLPAALDGARVRGHSLALLFIDLDEFKNVNDAHGHAAGDLLLKAASQRLKSLLRPSDQVARFGGDEFLVLLDPCGTERDIAVVAQRVVDALAAPFAIGEDLHTVGASVGIALYPRDGADVETLIRHADIAMYAGKNDGKGQYRFFDPTLSSSLRARARLKHDLVDAIEHDQLVLHYQPRVDPRDGRLLSMEALLRWRHPAHGMVPPSEFIPLAEATGLIGRIGQVVIEKACAQVAAWRDAGIPVVPVSINVSARQFRRGAVPRQLAAALERHRLPAALLEVEITESAMMGDHDEILADLAALRAMGIKLHVDDFGTGYSSLSQLQRLKMDVLKVDRAFTAELGKSREGRVFFQAIVSMAHALGMGVVAEGVETREQLAILLELGCSEIQGYLVARPVDGAAMAGLMARRFLLDEDGRVGRSCPRVQAAVVGTRTET
ncbi:EAL domain-containing protein [Massilia agilis]|uniref:EAL domain-containing protein n=1 Tax=Massilia agilis TaxID=1811226 RepID=A0ABT2DFF5_9BURK|nr:EAL domain-containing protein [Massilia agilis]MCS0810061.1 EAL domain-containing protein [Massilia agilis]